MEAVSEQFERIARQRLAEMGTMEGISPEEIMREAFQSLSARQLIREMGEVRFCAAMTGILRTVLVDLARERREKTRAHPWR
jgi:hypothetical protein